jgi:hypothetical protein
MSAITTRGAALSAILVSSALLISTPGARAAERLSASFSSEASPEATLSTDAREISTPEPSGLREAPTASMTAQALEVVGDANGDGGFDGADADLVASLLAHSEGAPIGPSSRSNVAEPCDGFVGASDLSLLRRAARGGKRDRLVESACHGVLIGDSVPAGSPPPYTRTPEPVPTLDDRFLEVANLVPAFGGFYVNANDEIQVVLTHTDAPTFNAAIEAILTVFGPEALPSDIFTPVPGHFGFQELHKHRVAARDLMGAGEVLMLDTDERRNRVTVGVAGELEAKQVGAALAAKGVPDGMIHFRIIERPKPTDSVIPALRSKKRGLRGGLQIGSSTNICTLGFIARRQGQIGFVTNSHCTATPGGINSNPYGQPDENDPVASELVDTNFFTSATNSDCPSGCTCANADASFWLLDPGVTARRGLIARDHHLQPYFDSSQVVSEGAFSFCGETLWTIGRSSGQDHGSVISTCADVTSDWGSVQNAPDDEIHFLCQYEVDVETSGGDSGSPVFKNAGSYLHEVELRGVTWGGSDTVWLSPMGQIETELGSLTTTYGNEPPQIEITNPTNGGTIPGGAFQTLTLEAEFFDLENGPGGPNGECGFGTCEVDWISNGPQGTSIVSSGQASLTVTLSGTGSKQITAVARDGEGATSSHTIDVTTEDAAAILWIEWPTPGSVLYTGIDYMFEGDSFDPDTYGPISCGDLWWFGQEWMEFPFGCTPLVSYDNPFTETLGLFGPPGTTGSPSVTFQVIDAPADAPPVVQIIHPVKQFMDPGSQSLIGMVQEPNGQAVTVEWRLLAGPGWLAGGVSSIALGDGNPFGNYTAVILQDADSLIPFQCGGNTVTLELRATDSDGHVGTDTREVTVAYPPC